MATGASWILLTCESEYECHCSILDYLSDSLTRFASVSNYASCFETSLRDTGSMIDFLML